MILDEGHKIKNPGNKCSKGVHSVPTQQRIILTGTPIQNNLKVSEGIDHLEEVIYLLQCWGFDIVSF